jgi:ribonuclease R
MDIHIAEGNAGSAKAGDMVEVEITTFPTETRSPVGRVVRVLGQIEDEGVDTRLILKKYGIPDAHEQEAVDEAVRLGDKVRPRDRRGRTDFRGLLTVTIDGVSARDFDDAITIDRLENGNFWLGVHIADVSHYVAEGSALDRAAYTRSTSVYFPNRAVHMFPAELSTGLCSLKPKVDRLVQSCLMEIDSSGRVMRYEIHDGVICSNERMTYADVDAVLTQEKSDIRKKYDGLVCMFQMMEELFNVLRSRRTVRGSIDFDLPAARFELDDAGVVTAIVPEERTLAHRLVEEFMLVANETVATELNGRDIPTLYRVHEEPDPVKVEEFEGFVTSFGYSLAVGTGSITPKHFQRLLERVDSQPEQKPITSLMLRAMQQARYDPVNKGHFGLAASFYTHFTSPIRRYPDLIVHRSLRAATRGELTNKQRQAWRERLPDVAQSTSERERRAEEAERELIQWKKVRFMADKVGNEFTGHITGVTAFGLFVELTEQFVEGLVHISSMADDYYRFVEGQYLLKGENAGKVYRLGDSVQVQLVRVDKNHRQLELGLMDVLQSVRSAPEGLGVRRGSGRRHGVRSLKKRTRKRRR